jgi:cytochrome P450
MASNLDSLDIVGIGTYADNGYPHQAWATLRREAPVYWYERPGVVPFWAITKHEDLVQVSKNPQVFKNAPRLAVFPDLETGAPEEELPARHLLNMDPPEHGNYRRLVSSRFTPRFLEHMRDSIERICRETLDEFCKGGERSEGDFVAGVAARFPLAVLADLLGVPREDWELLFRWTNETIGAADPEYQQGATAEETAERSRLALFQYFVEMVEKRRAQPRDDVVSVLANAKLDGEPVPPFELLSFFYVLVVAGNETTRNATSGGLLALMENPGELEKLRRNPGLVQSAVEEIVRWTSPVIQFCRTPCEDVELRGQKIKAGQNMTLFYPSANRDEDVFDAPFSFRVDRNPNPHLAFGIGEHFCLGANLARLELQVMYRQLMERLEEVELAGKVQRLRSSFVGGIKNVPIRYRIRARA